MTVNPNLEQVKLTDVTFAVVDLETTGFAMQGEDRICEIAIVRGKLGQSEPLDTWSKLVNPSRSIPYAATKVNHISNEMVQSQPPFAYFASEILDLLEGCVLIFHNGSFDYPFLHIELARAGAQVERLSKTALDTCLLARHNYSFVSNKLGDLIAQIGLTNQANPNHRALNDTLATWTLFEWLIKDLGKQGPSPLETVSQVLRLQRDNITRRVITTGTVEIHSEQTVTVEAEQDAQGFHWQAHIETETEASFEFFQISERADTLYNQWQSGEMPIETALPTLCSQFARLDDISNLLDEQLKTMRDYISQMLQVAGGKAEIPQFGKLQMSPPQTVTSFDRKRLDKLVEDLQAEGNQALAEAIAACKTESNRAGSLKINRLKS